MLNMYIERVTKIQNRAKSLKWGVSPHEEDSFILCCGHSPRRVLFFLLSATNDVGHVCMLDDSNMHQDEFSFDNVDDLCHYVIDRLKKHFPGGE